MVVHQYWTVQVVRRLSLFFIGLVFTLNFAALSGSLFNFRVLKPGSSFLRHLSFHSVGAGSEFPSAISDHQPNNTRIQQPANTFFASQNEGTNLRIIVVGCNRAAGLLRTLNSVKESNVPYGTTLQICVDGCNIPKVSYVARDFHWPYGEKILTLREKSFGLSKHITNCWENPQKDHWALFLEDDVIIDRFAFAAFSEAIQIRKNHEHSSKIVSIALHDMRVNQYCWRHRIKKKPCPCIYELCETESNTWSQIGTLLCLKEQSPSSWLLHQTPSSWGAFYEGTAWSAYQNYYKTRMDLAIGSSLHFSVPHSMSNEWKFSWKRVFMELMFRAGWTSMYRSDKEQKGFTMTFRDPGIHTLQDPKALKSEKQRKCLISLPLQNESSFHADIALITNANLLKSFDYCSFETSLVQLNQQGAVATDFLLRQSKMNRTKQFASAFLALHTEDNHVKRKDHSDILLSSGYDITFLEKAEIMIVAFFASTGKNFVRTAKHFESFGGSVHFLVVGPISVCIQIMRDNIYGTCVDVIQFASQEARGNHLPVLSKLFQAAVDYSGPNIKWIGYMDGDILFDISLLNLLPSILSSEICKKVDFRCVATGQRYDIDAVTNDEKIGSDHAMGYFFFTNAAIDYMLQDNRLPPFKLELVRWDSWLMAFLSSSDEINVIDLSKVLKVKHYTDFKDSFVSKTRTDLWNLKLADQRFRIGRIEYSNYRMEQETWALVPLMNATVLQKKISVNRLRWTFDEELEKITNFKYTSGPLPIGKYGCLCDLLRVLSPSGNVETELSMEKSLIKHCSQPDLIKQSSKQRFGEKIFFRNEFFSIVSGKEMNDLQLFMLHSKLFSENASECCVLTRASDAPKVIPDKFWAFDDKNKYYTCLVGQY